MEREGVRGREKERQGQDTTASGFEAQAGPGSPLRVQLEMEGLVHWQFRVAETAKSSADGHREPAS
eukprot:1991111-Rhodomonas_salina.1